AHQLMSRFTIVDAKNHVGRLIRSRPRTQHSTLNVIELNYRSDQHPFLKGNRARDLERISLECRPVREFIEVLESHVCPSLRKGDVYRDSHRIDGVTLV